MKNINGGTYEEIKRSKYRMSQEDNKDYKSQGNTLRGDTINEKCVVERKEG